MPYAKKLDTDIILNAGCAADLACTEHASEILNSISGKVYIPQIIHAEVKSAINDQPRLRRSTTNNWLIQILDTGLLTLASLETDAEWKEYSVLTQDHRLAHQRIGATIRILAKHRNWIVVCNDYHTMGQLDKHTPPGRYVSTIDLVKHWYDQHDKPPEQIGSILSRLLNVHYAPMQNHPLYDWWRENIVIRREEG